MGIIDNRILVIKRLFKWRHEGLKGRRL